jgi:hypothetical protein
MTKKKWPKTKTWVEISRSDTKQEKKKTKLTKGYNLINEAKLWYQMMRTSWSRNQETHNEDDTTPKNSRNHVW